MKRVDSEPLVSIIIPSFNQGRFIGETIRSCISQDYRPLEILVMDGGSTDETVDVLKSFDAPELQWISERDKGVVDAVNKGLDKARGDILTIQSSDDVFLPGAITAVVERLRDSNAGLVYGDVELIDENSNYLGADVIGHFDFAKYLGRFLYIPQPGTCFTRAAMLETGHWRPEVSYAADADYWMRIASKWPVAKVDQRLARYRYHPAQRDTQRARIARDWRGAVESLLNSDVLDKVQARYARMGIHLADYRYALPEQWWQRTKSLYAALAANPVAVLDRRFPKRELLPGREPIWRFLSQIKRQLGFKPS